MPRLLTIICLGLAIFFFVAINIWADRTFRTARLDLTEDRLYTITDGTRSVLKSIREPIRLRFYVSNGLDDLGPAYVALHKRASELLEEYGRISGGLLRVEYLDPKAFSPEEDLAVADGIQAIPNTLEDTQLFLGLSGTNSTDGRYVIAHLAPERAPFLEYDLTRMVHDLATPKKTVIGLLGDLPLQGNRIRQARPWAVLDAVERFFEIRAMFGTISQIDEEIDIVWLAEPGQLDETTLYALDQFAMRGGRILAFLDPYSEVLAAAQRGQNPPPPPRTGSLETLAPLLEAWGIDIPARKVVGDRPGALQVQMQKDRRVIVTDYLTWFMARKAAFAGDDLVTGNLKLMQFRSTGHIEARDGAETLIEPLVQTSSMANEIDLARIEYAPDPTGILADFIPADRRFVIAARISGPVKSAWPDGPPDSVTDEAAVTAHRTAADTPLALILVADSDVLSDHTWVENRNFLGSNLSVPYTNNGDFVVNALDQLSGSPAMIGLRGRGIADRGFTILEDMAQQAEQQYRSTERALREKIESLQRQIADLQKTEQEHSAILTAEQQSEIDRARGEMLDLRRELRDVRFALRRDVSTLKTTITALNMWTIPVLIGLLAVLIAGWRLLRNRRYREVRS